MVDIYGTDIKSDFTFTNGDINIVSGTQNLGQAICNRLNSDLTTYQEFYARYGGNLLDWLSEYNNANIHEYIRIEIESILSQDPRIRDVSATVSKEDNKTINVALEILTVGSDEVVTINLIIQEDLYVSINDNVGEYAERS